MPTVYEAVVEHLYSDPTIFALVGERVYSLARPDTLSGPTIVVNWDGRTGINTFDGETGLVSRQVDVTGISMSMSVVVALGQAVAARLNGYDLADGLMGAVAQVAVAAVFLEDEVIDYDYRTKYYAAIQTYTVWSS